MRRWLPVVFILGAETVSVTMAPLWAWIAVTAISGIAIPWFYRTELRAAWHKLRPSKAQHIAVAGWKEFDLLPLKFAACMWHEYPPTEASLSLPVVQEEIARLSLAVKQRKLEHRNGDTYHGALILLGINPANDQFSKEALVRYATEAGREIPVFLRPSRK